MNGEYVRIINSSSYDVELGGWRVRDSGARGYVARGYVFPAGARVRRGGSVYLHVGSGTPTATRFYLGADPAGLRQRHAVTHVCRDGGYLCDPQANLRAWHQYPCRYGWLLAGPEQD